MFTIKNTSGVVEAHLHRRSRNDGHGTRITNTAGVVTRTCDDAGKGGCPSSGSW